MNRQLPANIPPTLSSSYFPSDEYEVTPETKHKDKSAKGKLNKSEENSNRNDKKTSVGTQRGNRVVGTVERAHRNPIVESQTEDGIKPRGQGSSNEVIDEKRFVDGISVGDRSAIEKNEVGIQEKVDKKSIENTTTTEPRILLEPKAAVTLKRRNKTHRSRILEAKSQIVQKQNSPTTRISHNIEGLGTEVEEENTKLHEQIEKVQEIIRPITVPKVRKREKVRSWQTRLVLNYLLQKLIPRRK